MYVETNFVLEMILEQENAGHCRDILQLTDKGYEVLLPTLAIVEAQDKLVRLGAERRQLANSIDAHARELERSQVYRTGHFTPVRQIEAELIRLSGYFANSFIQVKASLDEKVTYLPTSGTAIDLALQYGRKHAIKWFDSLMLACIAEDLVAHKPRKSCFVTTDERFYRKASQVDDLPLHGCVLKRRFEDAYQYLVHSP